MRRGFHTNIQIKGLISPNVSNQVIKVAKPSAELSSFVLIFTAFKTNGIELTFSNIHPDSDLMRRHMNTPKT